jgi:hypothetical protein
MWSGKSIVVMDTVTIDPPYTVDHVQPVTSGHTGALDRIKRVLAAERKRLNLEAAAA